MQYRCIRLLHVLYCVHFCCCVWLYFDGNDISGCFNVVVIMTMQGFFFFSFLFYYILFFSVVPVYVRNLIRFALPPWANTRIGKERKSSASSMENFLVALQLLGLAAQAAMLVAWGYIFNLQSPKLGKDALLFKGGLLVVFVLWGAIKKYGSGSRLAETTVTKPFRLTMLIIGVYFSIAAAVCDFAGLSFPPWEKIPQIPDAPNWIWANMIATNFTFSLGLMYVAIAV